MTKAAPSLRPAWTSFRHGWNQFFHEPVDARVCALVRIGYAALVLVNLAVLWPDLALWYGADSVLPRNVAESLLPAGSWSVLDWLPPDSTTLHVCGGIFAAQAVCLLVGLLSRFNAVCVFAWLVSFQNSNHILLDGEDTVFKVIGFFLIWMPIGRAWSLDALARGARSATSASGWSLRLLQIQVALIYLSASLIKMQGDAWMDGTALYYVARLEDYFGRFPIPHWMFDTPFLVALLTWSVVAAEFVVPILIWFKETRLPCLAIALLFHLGCDYTMNLFLFHWIMLVGWLAFVTPEDLDRLARWFARRRTR